MTESSDILQGTLDMLVLRALHLGPVHGLGVSDRIKQITRGDLSSSLARYFPLSTGLSKMAGSKVTGANRKTTEKRNTIRSRAPAAPNLPKKRANGTGPSAQ